MQTGSSETLIGWKFGKPLQSLYGSELRERENKGLFAQAEIKSPVKGTGSAGRIQIPI
jgi:hypothetical protein